MTIMFATHMLNCMHNRVLIMQAHNEPANEKSVPSVIVFYVGLTACLLPLEISNFVCVCTCKMPVTVVCVPIYFAFCPPAELRKRTRPLVYKRNVPAEIGQHRAPNNASQPASPDRENRASKNYRLQIKMGNVLKVRRIVRR